MKEKVSLLYDTAREAASVNLVDLREGAVEAVHVLSQAAAEAYDTTSTSNNTALERMWKSPEFLNGLLSQQNLSYERGMATSQQNQEVDESIEKMLRLIGTMIMEIPPRELGQSDDNNGDDGDNNPIVLASLQIIEYLLRRYDIHVRPNTASLLLQTFLPLQVCYPTSNTSSIFSRIVALVDLQSVPVWTFLRPLAARGAPPLNRVGLAKRVAKDDALVGVIANIGKIGRDVCLMEGEVMRNEMMVDGQDNDDDGGGRVNVVRRGISTLISFSASILVEALYHQSKSSEGSVKSGGVITTGVQESMVRKILPLVLAALKSGAAGNNDGGAVMYYCPEWKEWGRLLASTLALLSPLSDTVKEALCNSTAEGMPISSLVVGGKKLSFSELLEMSSSLSGEEIDDATSAIMTMVTIMGSSAVVDKKAQDEDDDDWDYYLPMLPPSKNRRSNIVDYIGVDIAPSTYKILSKNSSSIAVAIGAILESIYGDSDEDDDEDTSDHDIMDRLAPFVASLVMHAFRRIEKEGKKALSADGGKKKKKGDEKFKADRDVLMLLRLIKEPSLARLWNFNQSSLIAAVSVHLVKSFNDLHQGLSEKSSSNILTERYKSILKALSEVNSSVRDQGVAYAINTTPEENRQESHLALLLERDAASLKVSKSSAKKDGRMEEEVDNAVSSLLPLRVALEHGDSKNRLDAVVRLNEQIYNESSEASVDIDAEMGQALLRRLCTEEDPEVAVAAGEILLSQLRVLKGNGNEMDVDEPPLLLASLLDDLESLANKALSALLHWTFIGTDTAWSPLSSLEAFKQGRKSEQNSIELESPLTSCIGICGVVAKLIGDEINVPRYGDDDLDQLTQLYCKLFVAIGAHINGMTATDNEDSDLTTKVSEVASEELLSFAKDGSISASVEEIITSSHIAEYVLEQCFSKKSFEAPPLLQNRFVWLALHAHSELHEELSSRIDAAYRVIDLIAFQMHSYTKESTKSESFEMEARFLSQNCDNYLSVLKSEDLDGFGNAIMKLASSSSAVSVDSIAKPAIASQLTSNASKTNSAPDLVYLVHACLRPAASKDGIVHILKSAKAALEGGKVSNEVATECIVPAFALLSHHVREVRESLIEMLENINIAKKDEKLSLIYDKVTDKSSPLRSSLLMDGVGTLPQALSQIVLSFAQPADLQSFLIKQCKSCALNEDDEIIGGGCQAAAVILSAMERSGERVFPLAKRWELGGKELFQAFLSINADEFVANPSVCRLRDCVATMLKGVLVNTMQVEGDGMSIQISVGPSSTGRRSRSYSIGASDSFSVLEPYPESMLQAILEALGSNSSPLMLSDAVVQQAVGRQSWVNGVFPKLDAKSKHAVASALLTLRTRHENEIAGTALLNLPMTAADLYHLLDDLDVSQSEDSQAAVVFITDCVREKSDLGKISDISKLSSKLFDQLLVLSSTSNNEGDSGGRDYTRVSILQTLLGIHQQYKSQISDLSADDGKKRRKRSRSHSDVGSTKSLATQANMLVGIVGGNPSTINPLHSGRGRSLALSLLTCLCEESPSSVSSSLLPALMSIAGKHSSNDNEEQARDAVDSRVLADALAAIIPAYCAHAHSADLTLFSLIESFVGKVVVPENGNGKLRTHLIDPFVNALKLLPTKEDSIDSIASLAASVLALQAFDLNNEAETTDEEDANSVKLNCHVLATSPSGIKIPISLLLLKYAEQLMAVICGASSFSADDSSSNLKAGMSEVSSLALRGSNVGDDIPASYSECNQSQQRSILYLTICLIKMVRDVTGTNAVKRLLRKSQGEDADVSLRLWQELLQAHMHALRAHAKLAAEGELRRKERKFWTAVPVAISECLENIQGLLPVPHFLASVSSTLADESTDTYMRKKTVRLLTDRVAEVSLDSAEASLFLEMVPELVAQVGVAQPRVTSDDEEAVAALKRNIIMQQGALVALESFVRSLCPASDKSKLTSKAADAFVPALESVTKLFSGTAASWSKGSDDEDDADMLGIKDAECQLLSSSSLCLASLVAVLKARCLPFLPSIVKPLTASLKSINLLVEDTDVQAESSESMLQLAILRLLETLAENMPQFLPPYLPLIFSNNALPSRALRRGDRSLKEATERVESALASKTPIRQLTPALSKALSNTLVNSDDDDSSDWEEACSILGVINASVGSSERSELPPVIGKIFNVLVAAYSYDGGDDCKSRLLSDANKVLLSLVMKLSESQLRQLYARLREWRGDIKEGDDDSNQSCSRRVAFWTLSAALSKSLRSIFLPCLTSVLTDVIDELEIAVSLLCQRPKHEKSKRRRVDEDSDSDSSEDDNNNEVSPLQPLLLCLESALKADAHEGGDWTRGDDNQRYNMILSHLGKLLMANVPKDLPVSTDLSEREDAATSSYQKLVEGQGTLEHGNVVGCLTALATAAGNEQLWKPLNFAVLEACSHKRSEVRRAGISCLLSIIETVGEEYMVLLPECLPVLSELLEDSDEDIAGMAKECVRQGEELLGESLEDSLR